MIRHVRIRWWAALLACGVATLAGAPRAAAATFCVADTSCAASGGQSEPDLPSALNAAKAAAGPDTVQIGPGSFSAPNGFAETNDAAPIAIQGAGRGATTLTATNAGATVLDVSGSLESTVSDLTIAMPPSGGIGVNVPAHIARVAISGGTGAATGLWTQNTTVADVVIALPLDGSANTGLYRPNGTVTADGLTITAHRGINGQGTADAYQHVRVRSDGFGIALGGSDADMKIDDAQIRMTGNGAGLIWSASFNHPALLHARFLTVQGDAEANTVGVDVDGSGAGSVASLTFEDSIIAGFAHAFLCNASGSASAAITARYSDFDPTHDLGICGGAPIAMTGDVSADPRLALTPAGDLVPLAGSPVIDGGDPALTSVQPATDLAGGARIVDGDGDGVARVDMGAIEAAPPAPPVITPVPPVAEPQLPLQPVLSAFSIAPTRFAPVVRGKATRRPHAPHRGATFRFRLSEAATVAIRIDALLPGRRVGHACRADSARLRGKPRCTRAVERARLTHAAHAGSGTLAFDGRSGRRALAPGAYQATIVARVQGAKASTPRTVRFTMVR